jgi:hypothetical protein
MLTDDRLALDEFHAERACANRPTRKLLRLYSFGPTPRRSQEERGEKGREHKPAKHQPTALRPHEAAHMPTTMAKANQKKMNVIEASVVY